MRNSAPAIPRLGVPKYDWWNEGCTVSPSPGGHELSPGDRHGRHMGHGPRTRMAQTISTEARAKYNQAMRDDDHEPSSASPSGRRTSISFAIRAGGAARRPTAKTRT